MSGKLTTVLGNEVLAWLRGFAAERGVSMGEINRIELEALMQNDLAAKAARALVESQPELEPTS